MLLTSQLNDFKWVKNLHLQFEYYLQYWAQLRQ